MASESGGEEEAVASRSAVPELVYLVRTCAASSGSRKEFSVFSRPPRLYIKRRFMQLIRQVNGKCRGGAIFRYMF